MTKLKKCPECGCIMKCVQWTFDDDSGSDKTHGDFDCRNCDHIENNIKHGVISFVGYQEQLLADVPESKQFSKFMSEQDTREIEPIESNT